jgi:integrase
MSRSRTSHLVVLVLAYTGIRFGELAALKVGRLDLGRNRAMIAQSVRPIAGQGTRLGPTQDPPMS